MCSCAAAYVLLAEEEATTITEAERLFRKALSIGKSVSNTSVFAQGRVNRGVSTGGDGQASATSGVAAILLCFSVEYLDVFMGLLDGHVLLQS